MARFNDLANCRGYHASRAPSLCRKPIANIMAGKTCTHLGFCFWYVLKVGNRYFGMYWHQSNRSNCGNRGNSGNCRNSGNGGIIMERCVARLGASSEEYPPTKCHDGKGDSGPDPWGGWGWGRSGPCSFGVERAAEL